MQTTHLPNRSHQLALAFRDVRVYALAVVLLLSSNAEAAYLGEKLLKYAQNYFILPLGIMATVGGLVAAIFKPEFIRGAAAAAIICAVCYFIIGNAQPLMDAMK